MHCGGEVLVSELRSTAVDDDIAVGSVADRCLPSGVIQTSHFKGVRTVFDPTETSNLKMLRPVECHFPLAARSQSASLSHCTRHVLGGVKCDDASSPHFSAARRSHGRSPLAHSSQRYP